MMGSSLSEEEESDERTKVLDTRVEEERLDDDEPRGVDSESVEPQCPDDSAVVIVEGFCFCFWILFF